MSINQARLVTFFGEPAVRADKASFLSQCQQFSLLILVGSIAGCQSVGDRSAQIPDNSSEIANVATSASELPQRPQVSSDELVREAERVTAAEIEPAWGVVSEVNVEPAAAVDLRPTARSSTSEANSLASTMIAGSYFSDPVVDIADGLAISPGMSLEQFESLAMGNNPTIQELAATTQKAAGFRTQVGLRANPSIGYNGSQLADQGTDQHTVFISQTIVTADKLGLNRRVLNEALRGQLLQLEAQKYRVATDIRIKFYDALAAQRRVQLIHEFQSFSDKGLEFAELRKRAEEGSQLDVVQAKVLKNEVDLNLQQAEVRFTAAWRELVAFAGAPEMAPAFLEGELPQNASSMDWSSVASTILVSSPEYQAAQTRVSQAHANICRQVVQPIPNIDLQLASGYDNGTDSGLLNLQVGAPIPVFNKNQGNIAAARAEYIRASREVERIENAIKARLAAASGEYDASLAAVKKYAAEILPNAKQGVELAEIAYKAGETSYVQVLIAQRSYFNTNLEYVTAQAQLAQARARVDGYVLTGALEPVIDNSGDDSLRGLTFSQQ